jgi:hypothetical protein
MPLTKGASGRGIAAGVIVLAGKRASAEVIDGVNSADGNAITLNCPRMNAAVHMIGKSIMKVGDREAFQSDSVGVCEALWNKLVG